MSVHETHASWVFVVGDSAYKVKKPVSLAFLDYSTLERRRAACQEEVCVNQRLAPGIYLGVRAIVLRDGRYRLAVADAPGAVEYAVHMRSFDEADTMRAVIARRGLAPAHIERVARRVAAFHAGAQRVAGGTARELCATWQENLRELRGLDHPAEWDVQGAARFGEAFARSHEQDIEGRVRGGYVRDAHGDLRCEHVLLTEGVPIVDRIEFDPALRHVDIAADLAFLAMDLEAHGEPGAARELERAYRDAGGSLAAAALQAFYGAHRAFVRAKVALLHDGDLARTGELASARAAQLWKLGELMCWRARLPLALVVCGPPASGKSTLAGELARRAQLPIVSSDVLRKRSAGIAPGERAREEHYSSAFSEQTYGRLRCEALRRVRRDGGVIVDATCRERALRGSLFAALSAAADSFLVIECRVALDTALARARRRMRGGRSISDATPQIVAEQRSRFEPLHELSPRERLELDTERELDRQVADVMGAIDRRLRQDAGAPRTGQ